MNAPSTTRRPRRGLLAATGLYLALTVLFAAPLSLEPHRRALSLGPDTRLFLWTLSWDVHALTTSPFDLFDANIFYPERRTLAYSEHLFGSALLAAPVLLATDNAVLALNGVALASCVLSALGAFVLARTLRLGVAASLLAGLVFAFAPPRFFRLGQLHLAAVHWIPFCLAALHRYGATGRPRFLLAATILFTLQAWSSGHGGLFLGLAALGLLGYGWLVGLFRPSRAAARAFGGAALLGLALNAPFLAPYLAVRAELGEPRRLAEAEAWSPGLASFLAAPTRVQSALLSRVPRLARWVRREARAYLFPGYLPLLLAGFAVAAYRRTDPTPPGLGPGPGGAERPLAPGLAPAALDGAIAAATLAGLLVEAAGGVRWTDGLSARSGTRAFALAALLLLARLALAGRRPSRLLAAAGRARRAAADRLARTIGLDLGFYALLFPAALWASLGPSFGLYAALYRLVPGFDFIRVPSRIGLLALLALAVLAGAGAAALARRRGRGLALAALVLVGLELWPRPLDAPPYAVVVPTLDRWLATRGPGLSLVELPVPDPRDAVAAARAHSEYMLHATAHWGRLVNGYSGRTPPRHDALFRRLAVFPDERALETLEAWNVGYVVVHREGYGEEEWRRLVDAVATFGDRLRLVYEERGGRIYALTRSRPSRPDRRW